MKTLNQQEVLQVSGGALDPELGLFKPTGIKLIDSIHASEWNSYGRPLYNSGVWAINTFFGTKIAYAPK